MINFLNLHVIKKKKKERKLKLKFCEMYKFHLIIYFIF